MPGWDNRASWPSVAPLPSSLHHQRPLCLLCSLPPRSQSCFLRVHHSPAEHGILPNRWCHCSRKLPWSLRGQLDLHRRRPIIASVLRIMAPYLGSQHTTSPGTSSRARISCSLPSRTTNERIAISPLRLATTSAACFSCYQPTAAFKHRIPIMTPKSIQSSRPPASRTASSMTGREVKRHANPEE